MAHEHTVYDSDPHFSIDVDTRVISYQSPSKLVLVKGDHNSEVFTFEMPRYIDGHDTLLCDIQQIHYINMGAESTKNVYEIQDLKTDENDDSKLVFTWLISGNATKNFGTLSFAMRFACSNKEDGTFSYNWRTLPYSSVPVSDSIDNIQIVVEDGLDLLQQWYNDIVGAGESNLNQITEAKNLAINDINYWKDQCSEFMRNDATTLMTRLYEELSKFGGVAVSTEEPTESNAVAWLNPETGILRIKDENGEFQPLESIRGEPGGLNNVAQETGDSEELVMSQKAVTDGLNSLSENIYAGLDSINNELSSLDATCDTRDEITHERIMELWTHIGSLENNEIANATDSIRVLNDTVKEHGSSIDSLGRILSDTKSSLDSDIKDLQETDGQLTKDIDSLEQKATNLEIAIHDIYDNAIQGIYKKNTSQDTSISALQTKDTEHDEAIEALQTEVADMVVIKTGSYVGNFDCDANPPSWEDGSVTIFIPFDVEYFMIRDMSLEDERSLNDLVLTKSSRKEATDVYVHPFITESGWTSPYYLEIFTLRNTGVPYKYDTNIASDDKEVICCIAYNWETTAANTTKITICTPVTIYHKDLPNIKTEGYKKEFTYNRKGVKYNWIAFGTKSQS